ncbi:DNA-processing protein DprA [Ruegeria sp. YS9]|uniref:DNA-processing protein DprA n=1 Tax=Ruegeria sp. YS9 TaxID=2966453 RepID=UPI00214CE4C9|nr:DNA-processing protein DprA [Ruegeria sp. YS9]UUV06845.1 DNA-processing protein DprA [Ruegeria sp. YS9]
MTEEQLSSNHPPLPPTTEEDRFSWLRLLRSRKVGPATFRRLLREHGSAQNALAALPEMARAAGITGYETCPPGVIEAELRAAKAAKARLLCLGSAEFPATLAELNEAPPLLWAIGDLSLLQKPAIAMVGARNCSSLGARMARGLATELGSKGHVIVSGLARGIDTAAHMAALETGTVAVMAGGVDVIYPAENTELAHDIASSGLRISEQPMGVTPQARHFPRRNRIISGLAQAVVVVEAAAKSGSLITARDALDQGREVLAVPGHPFDARAAGCNLLIRDGATLVRSAEDVIEALPRQDDLFSRPTEPPSEPIARPARNLHEQIIARLGPSPIAEDQLLRDIAASAGELGPALIDLELDGRIQRQPGGLLSLAS